MLGVFCRVYLGVGQALVPDSDVELTTDRVTIRLESVVPVARHLGRVTFQGTWSFISSLGTADLPSYSDLFPLLGSGQSSHSSLRAGDLCGE